MHDEVKKAIAQGKGADLRYFFVDSLNIDPTFAAYQEDFDYCRQHKVFEPQRTLTPFRSDERSWDKEYWLNLKADLQDNFSEERMRHMIAVARVIYKGKVGGNQPDKGIVPSEVQYSHKTCADNKKYRVERISPQDDPELKQEAELRKAREELAKQEAEKRKTQAQRPAITSKYPGGQSTKKAQGVPLLPIIGIIVLAIVILILMLR